MTIRGPGQPIYSVIAGARYQTSCAFTMSPSKKPSKLTEKLLKKDRRPSVQSFADTEDGVRQFIQTRTAFDSKGIDTIARDESDAGAWRVVFKGRRIIRAFVGGHPRAPDFEILQT